MKRRRTVFVLVALVVAALTFLTFDRDDPPDDSTEVSDPATDTPADPGETSVAADETGVTDDPPQPPPGSDGYRNRAGYAFHYPEAWNLDERGTAVEIVAPDSSVAMSFGIAPEGDVRLAMGTLLDAIEERYEIDAVRGPKEASLGTTDGVSVWGEAVNEDGVPIVFAAFIVEGETDNYGVTVFSTRDADDAEVRSILDSFTMS